MTYEHRAKLKSILATGTQWHLLLFSFLCAERVRPCCWAFGKDHERDVSQVALGCDLICAHLLSGAMPKELEILIEVFPQSIYSTEEFGSTLATQAKYGMLALDNTLELCRRDDVELATESAVHVVDAIDNFLWFASNSEPGSGSFEQAEDSWLLSTELERRVRQAKQVIEIGPADLVRLRVENRQYAIPIAVR